jgi:hypothetical protein
MNKVIEEMIKKAKATSILNRGQYRATAATNIFNQDGTSVEEKSETSQEPDVSEIKDAAVVENIATTKVEDEEPDATQDPSQEI